VALNRAVECWLKTDAYTIGRKVDPESGDTVRWAQIKEPPPVRLSILAGDALHNFRTALDHVVYAIAEQHLGSALTPAIEAKLMFPIVGNENSKGEPANGPDIFGSNKGAWLYGIPSEARDFIENEQPYRRFHDPSDPTGRGYLWDPLWNLYDLERIDKHRRLNVTSAWLGMPSVSVPEGSDPRIKWTRADGPVQNGDIVVTYSGASEGVDAHLPRNVTLAEGTAANQAIATTFQNVRQRVAWIVGQLERIAL